MSPWVLNSWHVFTVDHSAYFLIIFNRKLAVRQLWRHARQPRFVYFLLGYILWGPVNFPWNWSYFQKPPVKSRIFLRELGWSLLKIICELQPSHRTLLVSFCYAIGDAIIILSLLWLVCTVCNVLSRAVLQSHSRGTGANSAGVEVHVCQSRCIFVILVSCIHTIFIIVPPMVFLDSLLLFLMDDFICD